MPTYQYVCTNPEGKHEFEVVQSFTDAAVTTCPECGSPVRKVYGSVGVVFKGSGFYRTDSRKAESASTPAAAKESNGSSSKESSGGSKDSSSSSSSTSSAAPAASKGSASKAAD
ncbi:Transcriptional regulator, FmdB family [Modestobacter italicus]|uniref:Transcriptional regulator, FmdB family n=1 Tax=Modestobacter italicus (strain DSM 44449 / CECT 9708 / BC 501) TaxID=2732864 RepID=I4ESL0_MODI5|nr:FmdB family zinc ribbon protein [Modestobacter marinus]CCH86373.1 Transcriptional regulator, FmdB family [Modestobacter marinus]